jgi:hypothetical protein
MTARARVVQWITWVVAMIAFLTFLWRVVLPAAQHNTFAFSVYYTSARLALQGEADSRLCEEWFFEQQRALGLQADTFCGAGLPTMALVMAPLAWLRPEAARIIWVTLDLAIIAAICMIARRVSTYIDLPRLPDVIFFPLAILTIALYQPLAAELRAGQIYIFQALFYSLWLYGFVAKRDWLCSVSLACLALVKLAALPLWLFMAFHGRWRALVLAIAIILAVILATFPMFGAELWQVNMQRLIELPSRGNSSAVTAYQTVLSLFKQLFTFDATWSPRPLADVPILVNIVVPIIGVTLAAATLFISRRRDPATGAMAMLCLLVPFQPTGEQYHYTFLFVVILVLLPLLNWRRVDRVTWTMFVAALVLFALPSYFLDSNRFTGFPIALIAYPRMYGALVLWALLLFKLPPKPKPRPAQTQPTTATA